MYDFHDSTDTLKFWTEKRAINKSFFGLDFFKFSGPLSLCMIFTILLRLWNSEQKNGLLIKRCFSSDFDETWRNCSTHGNYNFTKFHQNQMKNKKVLLIARFSVPNFKLSVESWNSYIVPSLKGCSVQKFSKDLDFSLQSKKMHFFSNFCHHCWQHTQSSE